MNDRILIGITDCSKYANYERWMLAEEGVDTICLSYRENNLNDIIRCDGVLLTGGEDVDPKFYKRPDYLPLCDRDNMDGKRDEFELRILKFTQQNNIPLLGICRGLQIANVFFGGSLIPDLPSSGKENHSKFDEGKDRIHEIRVNPFSRLQKISGMLEGSVNSAHHQSADQVGKGLVAAAFSGDGVVEALERKTETNDSWLMLVQWHPERMDDQQSGLAGSIKKNFVETIMSLKIKNNVS